MSEKEYRFNEFKRENYSAEEMIENSRDLLAWAHECQSVRDALKPLTSL